MIHISAIIFFPLWGRLYTKVHVSAIWSFDFGCYNVTDRSYSWMAVKHGSTVTCSIVSQVVRYSLSRSSITFMGVPDMCLLNYVCTIYSRIYRSGVAWTSECMRTNP